MWLRISLPAFSASGAVARLARRHASPGSRLDRGDSLLDLTVDMSGGVVRDCPPISTCRIILQEAAWLRAICIDEGAEIGRDAVLALLSTEPDEREVPPQREARVTAASMLVHTDWWTFGA